MCLAFAFVSMVFPPIPILLEEGTLEIQQRDLSIPLLIAPEREKHIRRVQLFFSNDRGASWKYLMDWDKDADKFLVIVPRDGLYWFSHQIITNDGKAEPPDVKDFRPGLKVYVNSEKRPVINRRKSYKDLERDVEELQQKMEQLKRKVKELESGRATQK